LLNDIDLNASPMARAALNDDAVAEYAKHLDEGNHLPPIDLVELADGSLLIASGSHRYAAACRSDRDSIMANVQPGDRSLAVRIAAGSNIGHGVRRTNADKRAAITLLLKDPKWKGRSDSWISDVCGVDNETVARARERLAKTQVDQPREGKDGKMRPATKPKPEPKANDSITSNSSEAAEAPAANEPEPPNSSPAPIVVYDAVFADELDTLAACPNCGGNAFDADGDCTNCRHPCGDAIPNDETPKHDDDAPQPEPGHLAAVRRAAFEAANHLPNATVAAFLRDLADELVKDE